MEDPAQGPYISQFILQNIIKIVVTSIIPIISSTHSVTDAGQEEGGVPAGLPKAGPASDTEKLLSRAMFRASPDVSFSLKQPVDPQGVHMPNSRLLSSPKHSKSIPSMENEVCFAQSRVEIIINLIQWTGRRDSLHASELASAEIGSLRQYTKGANGQ